MVAHQVTRITRATPPSIYIRGPWVVMKTVELSACTVTFLNDDVVHAHFRDGHTGGVDDVQALFAAIAQERGGRKALLMVSMGPGASLTNEARAYASGVEGDHIIAADAIIVRDFGHQLAANAFVRYNRPGRPAQLFPDKDSAVRWLLTNRERIERP